MRNNKRQLTITSNDDFDGSCVKLVRASEKYGTLNESFLNSIISRSFTRVSITGTKEKRKLNARTRRCEEGPRIKGTKGTGSETKGHNAVSVNCDARIKETVTPGKKEMRKEKASSERGQRDGMRCRRENSGRGGKERRIFGGFAVVNNAL